MVCVCLSPLLPSHPVVPIAHTDTSEARVSFLVGKISLGIHFLTNLQFFKKVHWPFKTGPTVVSAKLFLAPGPFTRQLGAS